MKMEHHKVQVSSWSDGHKRIVASRGPVSFRLSVGQIPKGSFLDKVSGPVTAQIAMTQPDRETNFTKMVLLLFKDGRKKTVPPALRQSPGDGEDPLKWGPLRLTRMRNKNAAGFKWVLRRRVLDRLAQPVPVGPWEGMLTFDRPGRFAQTVLLEMNSTRTLQQAEEIKRLGDLAAKRIEPAPEEALIVVPGAAKPGGSKLILPPGVDLSDDRPLPHIPEEW